MSRAKENLYFVQTSQERRTQERRTQAQVKRTQIITWKQYPKAHAFIVRIPIYHQLRARRKLSLRTLNFFFHAHNFVHYNFLLFILFLSDLCALKRPYILIFLWQRLHRNQKCSKIRTVLASAEWHKRDIRTAPLHQKHSPPWSGRGIMKKYASNNKRHGNDYLTNIIKCKITCISSSYEFIRVVDVLNGQHSEP